MVLDYDFAQNRYTVQFPRPVDVTGQTSEWTSEQGFEKLVDCILFVAENKNRKVFEHNIIMGRTAAFV